jgi:hypothetical protein
MQSYTISLNAVLHDFTFESDADWYHKYIQRCFVGLESFQRGTSCNSMQREY